MKKDRQGNRFTVPALAIAALLAIAAFALLPDADSNVNENEVIGAPGDYNTGDIAAVNVIIAANGLSWTAAPDDGTAVSGDFGTWDVAWNYDGTEERIVRLTMTSEGMTGTLDVSGLTALRSLYCDDNDLTSLDVSGLAALEFIDCSYNDLTSLNLTGCTALEILECGYNDLTSLDLTGLTALYALGCNGNFLASLDVSMCTLLEYISCYDNGLASLDVSACAALLALDCSYNSLTSLNVSGCTLLDGLNCYGNQLASLDVSACTALTGLDCGSNKLTSLDVSGCTALEALYCDYNELTSLDVSGCTLLETLLCNSNQLAALDMSGFASLTGLYCDYNELASLNVSGCTALEYLVCYENKLTSLDLTGITTFIQIYCQYNHFLSESDVIGFSGWDGSDYIFYDQHDITPPTVASVTPTGTGAAVAGVIIITFSEVMDTTPGTVQLNSLTALTGGSWSSGGTVFTISYSGLAYGTSFTVNISGFADLAGNIMTADGSNSFTTMAAPDTTKPTITSASPSGTGVANVGYVTLVFSEPMDTTVGTIELGIFTLAAGSWSSGNTVYTAPYSVGTLTYYEIRVTAFSDVAGNVMDPDNSNSFTTASGPVPLTFTDSSAYDIPASVVGIAITDINVSGGVSGGTAPYAFEATGLPAGLSINASTGILSGTPTAACAAGTATITVTDNASSTDSITISYGAVSDPAAPAPRSGDDDNDGDNTMIIIAVIAVIAVAAGIAVYWFVLRKK